MRALRPLSVGLLLLVVASLDACGGGARDELPAGYDRESTIGALESALGEAGFDVSRGSFVFFEVADCEGLPSCFGNNPSSPYGLFRVPAAPGEDASGTPSPLSDASGNTRFRLRADEALLFLGRTPPRAKYFSFITYVATHAGSEVFGSVTRPANHLTLETSGSADDPFDREVALIVTADTALADELRGRLVAAGLGSIVNVQTIPSEFADLGLAATDDSLTMLARVALFDDAEAGAAYVEAPPASLLRIRPKTERAITAASFEGYRPTGTGTNEDALAPALDRLHEAITTHHTNAGAAVTSGGFVALSLVGTDCVANGWQCNGDNPDTVYWGLVPRVLGPSDRIVVYGVDHRRTGKATYTNASVYDYATLAGTGAAHDDAWAASATSWLGPADPDADRLFVWTFARECGADPFCSVVPTSFPGVALDANLTVVVRAYLEQATSTAPNPDEVLAPRVVYVTGP